MSEGFRKQVASILCEAVPTVCEDSGRAEWTEGELAPFVKAITALHEEEVGRLPKVRKGNTWCRKHSHWYVNITDCPACTEATNVALRLTIKELVGALEPFAGFMMTAKPGEYMKDSINARIEWHDTERAREVLARVKDIRA